MLINYILAIFNRVFTFVFDVWNRMFSGNMFVVEVIVITFISIAIIYRFLLRPIFGERGSDKARKEK